MPPKLTLSADVLVAIGHVLEQLLSGGMELEFETKDIVIKGSVMERGQKIRIEIESRETTPER